MSSSFPSALPAPRTADPRDAPPMRWGVLAPGSIADKWAHALSAGTRQRIVAVGSRSPGRARAYADRHGVERAYGSYDQLVADPDVDIVYVASPHSEHRDQALLAIAAGKSVLVEKSFTRNAGEAAEVAQAARSAGVVAMEAMWTRFLPEADIIRRLLADGALGSVQTVLADHGQRLDADPVGRAYNPALAGGALLDLGVYPVSFAASVLGTPDRIVATGSLTDTGVDAQIAVALWSGAAQAVLSATMTARTPCTASICGTTARIELAGPFYAPTELTLAHRDGRHLTRAGRVEPAHLGFCYEIAHLAQLVADGATDSPLLPIEETVAILGTMDEIRRQLGVVYPGE